MTAVALVLAVALAAGPRQAPAELRAAPADETPVSAGRIAIPGRVILDAASSRAGMPAVTFDHWNHRALFTCRVCHVDLAFAMKAGETAISARSNEDGAYCGACHDGRRVRDGRAVFRACSGWPRPDPARGCLRCHTGRDTDHSAAYEQLRRSMPVDVAGDVDWVAAWRQGRLAPADLLEGVTPSRPAMRIDRNVEIHGIGTWMKDVVFSHRRHVGWIACELCHPDVFPIGRGGEVRYRMADMRAGRSCGACHASVAFPLSTCQRCHGRARP